MGSHQHSPTHTTMKAFLCMSAILSLSLADIGAHSQYHAPAPAPAPAYQVPSYVAPSYAPPTTAAPTTTTTPAPVPVYKPPAAPAPSYGAPVPVYNPPAAVPVPVYQTPTVSYQPAPAPVYPAEIIPYSYTYTVSDDYNKVSFGASETSDGASNVEGSYHVALPDGRTQHVAYTAKDNEGYIADVTYQGEAQYPPAPVPAPAYGAPPPTYQPSSVP